MSDQPQGLAPYSWCIEFSVKSVATPPINILQKKNRIILERLRGEERISVLCRREGLIPNLYYKLSKGFLEAEKHRLIGDTKHQAINPEVVGLRLGEAREFMKYGLKQHC